MEKKQFIKLLKAVVNALNYVPLICNGFSNVVSQG